MNTIKIILGELNISQARLAKAIGVSSSFISLIAHGKSDISSHTAKSIENVYGYSAEWILTGEGEKKVTSVLKNNIIHEIQDMTDRQKEHLIAFIQAMKEGKI
jgi:transcriptional regulator with XRE-family HTH domain